MAEADRKGRLKYERQLRSAGHPSEVECYWKWLWPWQRKAACSEEVKDA